MNRIQLITCLFIFIGACSKQAKPADYTFHAETEQYLRIKLATSIEAYGEKLQKCINTKQLSPIEKIDHEKLKDMNFTKEEITSSIFVIALNNEKRCYEDEYYNAVYDHERYKIFLDRYKILQSDIDFTNQSSDEVSFQQTNPYNSQFTKQAQALFAVNTSQEYLDKEMIYESLTAKQKKYLNDIFSAKNFMQYDYIISNNLHKYKLH